MAAKVALVTGSNSGLGLSLSVMLAKEGWKVWAGMRDPASEGKDLLDEAESHGIRGNVTILEMDVNDDESVSKAVKTATADGPRLDLLVNNAEFGVPGTLEMVTMEKTKAQFETNVFGVMRCTQAALPTMRAQKSGKIVYISSLGGVWGQCFNDIYCASKFAIEGMAESQCAVLREFGVHVTCVQPGTLRMEFAQNVLRPHVSAMPVEYKDAMEKASKFYESMPSQSAEECARAIMDQVVNVESPPLRMQPDAMIKEIVEKTQVDASGEVPIWLNMTKILGKPGHACCPPGARVDEVALPARGISVRDGITYYQVKFHGQTENRTWTLTVLRRYNDFLQLWRDLEKLNVVFDVAFPSKSGVWCRGRRAGTEKRRRDLQSWLECVVAHAAMQDLRGVASHVHAFLLKDAETTSSFPDFGALARRGTC